MSQFTVRGILAEEEPGDISQVIQSFSFNTVRYLVRSKISSRKYDQDMKTFSSCETASNVIMDFGVSFCSEHYTETIIRSTGWSWCVSGLRDLGSKGPGKPSGLPHRWRRTLTVPAVRTGILKGLHSSPLLVTPPLGRTSPEPAKCIKWPISL